jgi:transcriptional regulator with XRE-family HTH domain
VSTDVSAAVASDLIDDGTVGLDLALPPVLPETQTAAMVISEDLGYLRQQARVLHQEIDEHHQRSHFVEWRARTSQRGRSSPAEMLEELARLGFAWRDIARLIGVTVQAIQKWRRGARTTGENRHRIAGLLAACDQVSEDYEIHEVASWFEMPLLDGVPVTPIDLWEARRPDLVFDYASAHADAEQTLSAWDPEWRERYRSDYEVFRAGDGRPSLRLKDR